MSLELPAPSPAPPRWTGLRLPSYRYLPGLHPHPFRHPQGHLWSGGGPPEVEAWTPVGPWCEDGPWVRGLELCVHRYYWEAHEVWEGMWKPLPRKEPDALVLQSLVQLAAAAIKLHQGKVELCGLLTETALARMDGIGRWRGLDLVALATHARECAASGALLDLRAALPEPPPRVLRVVAGAIVRDGRVLIARKPAGGPRGGLWELPGGKVEVGEEDDVALERELFEELGVRVRTGTPLGEFAHRYDDLRLRLVGYGAALLEGEPEAREHAELRWVGADDLGDRPWAAADLPLLAGVGALLSGAR